MITIRVKQYRVERLNNCISPPRGPSTNFLLGLRILTQPSYYKKAERNLLVDDKNSLTQDPGSCLGYTSTFILGLVRIFAGYLPGIRRLPDIRPDTGIINQPDIRYPAKKESGPTVIYRFICLP